jgi:NADH dehydrogenase
MSTKRVTHVNGVLIVGGGYAGVHAARAVRCAGEPTTIIDPTDQHDFVTRLASVAGGTGAVGEASTALAEFADDLVLGRVVQVADGSVVLDDGRKLSADALIVTAGAVSTRPPVDGIDHAWPLRTADDARALRAQVESADAVVIVGGGATGVQLAGSIAAAHRSTHVTVIEAADGVLAGMGRSTGRDAARILKGRGVDLVLGQPVESIDPDGVVVDGERYDGTPVWAAGFDARADSLGLPPTRAGQVRVEDTLLVDEWDKTFAAGDVAAHSTRRGVALPMSAQVAVQAGEAAGANAARLLQGETLEAADLNHRGWVLDLGGFRGLAEVGPAVLTAPFLDLLPPLLHWGIDVKHLIETRGLAGLLDAPGR